MADTPNRVWFYRPSWYWHGLWTLSPINRGHDEFCRWTLVLGWTITGRIVIALMDCRDPECHAYMVREQAELAGYEAARR